MKITVRELTTIGPTIHSSFAELPFKRATSNTAKLAKPVLAIQTPSCIKIVGNTHHFLDAQEAGQPTVPAYLIQDSESTLELLELVIEYYAPMTLLDKALLARAALELGVPRPMLAEKLLPVMELAPREKLIDQLLFLLKLPLELQAFTVEKDLSLKRALIFKRAELHLDWVTRFISNLKIGINMTAEIIQNVWEMAGRDDVDFKTKAQEMELWQMADTQYEDPRLAVMEIRQKINAARFPALSKAGVDLSREIDLADLPESVKIKWDPYFEQQGLNIAFHAKDASDLELTLQKLSSSAFKHLFKHI